MGRRDGQGPWELVMEPICESFEPFEDSGGVVESASEGPFL